MGLSARAVALGVAALVAALDRATKLWIQANVGAYDTIPVIPNVFNIVYARNRGAAFGILSDASETVRISVLVVFSLGILAFVFWMLWQATRAAELASAAQRWALTLVAGGAVGNLYDRIVEGSVTDFLQVFLGSYEWPSFNVADSAITVGAVLMGYELLFQREKKDKHVSETH